MSKAWMPLSAGVIDIVLGALYAGGPVFLIIYFLFFWHGPWDVGWGYSMGILGVTAVIGVPSGIYGVVGGVRAARLEKWSSALKASIVLLLPSLLFWGALASASLEPELWYVVLSGVPAILLLLLSKKQFKS